MNSQLYLFPFINQQLFISLSKSLSNSLITSTIINLIIFQMNLFTFLCCREKKPPQTTKIVQVKQQPQKYQYYSSESQPFVDKDKYVGQQLNGLPHGNGEMFYKNGDYYRGEWVNGKRQGRGVQMYHQTGIRYQGQWKSNLPNGQGKLLFENQSYYVGEFKDNQKHGKGQFYNAQQSVTIEQVFQNGVMIQQKVKSNNVVREQQFPTLVLDKERFNSDDLLKFQQQNPEIKQLQIEFLAKYFAICKIIKLSFIDKQIKEWSVSQVIDFLQAIDLQFYKDIFYKNRIKGKDLITLSQQEMKQDLKMKLGDRKRLKNYCKYLPQLYNLNEQKKEKQNKKKISQKKIKIIEPNRPRSLNAAQYTSNKFTVEDVIEQKSQSFKSSFQHSEKSQEENQNQKNLKNKFGTDEWDQYHSNVLYSLAIPIIHKNQPAQQDQLKEPPKSQPQESSSSQNDLKNSVAKNGSIRKFSQDNADQQLASIHLKQKANSGLQFQLHLHNAGSLLAIQADHNQKKSSTSSSEASVSSVQFQLQRKKTSFNRNKDGGMEMRELYEFLKERGNLDFIIKPKDIDILQLIGEGGYGKVYQGKYMSCPVAVKDYIKAGKHKCQQDFLKQLGILSDLKHPNIVLYMGLCITSDKYQLVTQYLQNGSLFDQLHKKKKKFTRNEIVQIIDDIVKGMVYLHNMKNILHRDLKSSNVLIGQDWKVKLCDFGLSGHRRKSSKKSKNRVGTYQWMAPEVMRKEQMDFFSDVYSFGVIIWQLITEQIPYEGYTQAQIIGEVGYDENYMLKIQNSQWQQEDFVVKLMQECLKRKPSQRPTFIQIQSKLTQYLEWLEGLRQNTYSY